MSPRRRRRRPLLSLATALHSPHLNNLSIQTRTVPRSSRSSNLSAVALNPRGRVAFFRALFLRTVAPRRTPLGKSEKRFLDSPATTSSVPTATRNRPPRPFLKTLGRRRARERRRGGVSRQTPSTPKEAPEAAPRD